MNTVQGLMEKSEQAAKDALCRYKFERFGYHASQWVMLNKLLPKPKPSPFRDLVAFMRRETQFEKPLRKAKTSSATPQPQMTPLEHH